MFVVATFAYWVATDLAGTAETRHSVVYYRKGEFAAWPANGGLWTWDGGQEVLVGFCVGRFKEQPGHNILPPYSNILARSRDGGQTWRPERPAGYAQPGTKFAVLKEPVNFAHRDFAMRCIANGYHGAEDAEGGFLFSYDRGRSWSEPFRFNGLIRERDLRGWEITCRTDYVTDSPTDALLLLSARPRDRSGADRVFWARLQQGGRQAVFGGWVVGKDDPYRAVMPSTVRVSATRLISAIRRRVQDVERCWVDAYVSNDDGRTWKFLSKVGDTGAGNGNPPALTRLHDARLACAYGNRNRKQMLIRLSDDEGATWGEEVVLRGGFQADKFGDADFGYPRLFQRADRRVVCVYYWSAEAGPEACIAATTWRPIDSRRPAISLDP
jgi:hypothetical protein